MPKHCALKLKPLWLSIGYLLIAYVFYSSLRPDPIEIDISNFDKYAHTFAYFVLMAWFMQMYQQPKSILLCALAFISMGVLIEILQGMSGIRFFDYYDMFANALGVFIAWLLSPTPIKNILFYIEQHFFKI